MPSIAPTQDSVQIALRAFLLDVLPAGVDVIAALQNRVPEPAGDTFVVMTPIRFVRLRTNIDGAADCRFTGSIAGTSLTASFGANDFGTIAIGAQVFGTGAIDGTTITAGPSGGGAGVYTVDEAQTLSSRTLSTGQKTLEQGAQVTVQLDFHSLDNSASSLAQTVSTILRDEAGVDLFATLAPDSGVVPLYADDPRMTPFTNEEQQIEWRWMLEVNLQVNQVVVLPQQYADSVVVELIDVDAADPP